MKVSNGKCIRRLAWKSLMANRTRNLIAVLAIALTAVLFTSLFTIALSINEGIQQSNFRQVGGFSHGGFKYLTEEQCSELKDDPLIGQWGVRRFLGMPTEAPFNKAHVEVGWSDANYAHWSFCDPVEGSLPQEGTDQAATDTQVLALLGMVDAILDEVGVDPNTPTDGMTGAWNLDVMLKSGSRHIQQDLDQILAGHGYQSETPGENYIDTGINWGYTGAQLSDSMDPATAAVIAGMLLLILLTGYLIIYNVFQISVAGDIRFYGLLKTIGTTGRQLKRIIRYQALALSALGIPLGLLAGWLIGGQLTPVIISHLDGVSGVVSVSPVLFLGSALFALFTVLLSCHRPGRVAAKVSPIEAVRYTEGAGRKSRRPSGKRLAHKGAGRSSLPAMAWANLGRSRGKTAVTITSLSLAVVLLTVTVNFTNGFDMDKYVSNFTASDFIVANAGKFQNSVLDFTPDMAVPQSAMDDIGAQGGITDGGVVYGQTSSALEYITEDYFRQMNQRFYTPEQLDSAIRLTGRNEAGDLAANVQLSGMSPFALDHLTVLEGDLSKLYEDGGTYVAAVYAEDDYGKADMDSHWARLGDTVTIRYVEEWEYVDPDTGIAYSDGRSSTGMRRIRWPPW